jgi:hypothetical protein
MPEDSPRKFAASKERKDAPPVDYRSSGTSPYDKPVERYVRVANAMGRFRIGRRNRALYYVIVLPLLLLAIWYLRHLVLQMESIAGK